MGTEIDDQRGSLFDTGDRAETVLVVGDLVVYREALGRRIRVGSFERTGCQVTPGTGGVRAHHYQYAPACGCGPHGLFCTAGSGGGPRTCGGCLSNRFRAGLPASRVEVAHYLGTGGQQARLRVGNTALGAERLHGRLGLTQTRPRHACTACVPTAESAVNLSFWARSPAAANRARISLFTAGAAARGNEPAAGQHLRVRACRGTVNQSAWTWSACGPLGPWLTVYSTFWLSARVR